MSSTSARSTSHNSNRRADPIHPTCSRRSPATAMSPSTSPASWQWLHVAFWKKPLHLIGNEHHHHPHRESPCTSDTTSDSASTTTASSLQTESDETGGTGADREMERTLGLFDLIMIGIGGTVGSGVFATAGLIASVYAGPAAILSWLIAGIGCILSGFSFMELSCLIPSTGSTYAYAYHSLGELPAMFAGFLLTLEYGVSSAGGARSWSDKLTNWMETELQITGPEWMKPKDSTVDLYAGLLMTACVVVVLCGMQAGKMLVNVVTMTKISVVVFIIVFGFMKFDAENITPLVPDSHTNGMGQVVFGWPGVFLGASASFFGYIGYDEVCCLAGEAKNPTKNIPRAVIGTILGAATLSTLATFALVGMQKYTDIDKGESYGKAFEHAGWTWAATIVSTGEVVTMPITTFIGFLAQPRVQYAMAKDGLLPGVFARVDANGNLFHGTLICGVAITLIAVFVPFHILWNFISLGILVAFNLTNSSLLLVRATKLHERGGSRYRSIHSYLIGGFLVTSFLAAYHWQKSVIAFVPITHANASAATFFDIYMDTVGPSVAVLFTTIAAVIMCFLKYIEASTDSSAPEAPKAAAVGADDTSMKTDKKKLLGNASSGVEVVLSESSSSHAKLKKIADKHPGASLRERALSGSDDDGGDDQDNGHRLENGHAHNRLRAVDLDPSREKHEDDADRASSGSESEGSDDDNDKPATFQAPFVPFAPCVAIFFNWFLFAQMDFSSVVLILLWLLLALAVYVGYSIRHSLAHQQLAYHRVDAH